MNKVEEEASMKAFLKSDELLKTIDLYYFDNNLYIIIDYVGEGSMADIVKKDYMNYSEDFCRYSLYKVALGLLKMHNYNVLHRNINSDHVLFHQDGSIFICDFGLSFILSSDC